MQRKQVFIFYFKKTDCGGEFHMLAKNMFQYPFLARNTNES